MQIYYLGPSGSYSSILARDSFPEKDFQHHATKSFREIFQSVLANQESIGIIPIENSITSDVRENVDYLFAHDFHIIGEAQIKITLHLIGLKQSSLADIKHVYSHPKALNQSSRFLETHHLQSHETSSTADGQQTILVKKDPALATIGSAQLASHPLLKIISPNIGNEQYNLTRFVFISQKPTASPASQANKVTFIFKIKHQSGALGKVLQKLAKAKANLTMIESLPIPGSNFEYQFWIDLEGDSENIERFIQIIKENSLAYRVVGQYQQGKVYES